MYDHLKRVALVAAILMIGFVVGQSVQAQGPQPGSQQDPLVSQSYVDALIAQTRTYVDSKVGTGDGTPPATPSAPALEIVQLSAGTQIAAEAGTEIILRSGSARVVAGAGGGISDLTSGRDLAMNEMITANHLLLVPRTDGRGLVAVNNIVVLVRGPFVIVK